LYRFSIHLIFLLLLAGRLTGQPLRYQPVPASFEMERVKIGNLSNGIFTGIKTDEQGYLWMSSSAGLHVFDGRNRLCYLTGSKSYPINGGTGSNIFGEITTDEQGKFWLVDNEQVLHYDPINRRLLDSFSTGDKKPAYFRFGQQSGSTLYYVFSNAGEPQINICRKKRGAKAETIFQKAFVLNKEFNYSSTEQHQWLFLPDEIIRVSLDGKLVRHFASPVTASFYVYANKETVFFAGIRQDIIYWWNPATDQLEVYSNIPANIAGKMQAIYVEDNLIYIASNLNLFILDRNTGTVQDLSPQFTRLVESEAPGHLSETLISFGRQKGQGILLQTAGNLYRLKRKMPPLDFFGETVITNVPEQQSKPISYRGITESESHDIYASYYTGISVKKSGQSGFVPLPTELYRKGDLISTYSLQYWKQHLLWNNVKIHLPTGKIRYMFDSSFSGHCTQYLRGDSCWLFKWNTFTLHCYDLVHDRLISYPLSLSSADQKPESRNGDMNDIVEDINANQLWVSSHDYGLCRISKQGQLLKQYKQKELGTTDNYITDLERIGDQLWFGCTDGLGQLNIRTGQTTIYRDPSIQNNQLLNRAVFSILPDEQGNFYLGSSNGLLYFNTRSFNFFNLPDAHPLAHIEFNRASAFKASDGRYYMGSTNGLFSFKSTDLEFILSSEPVRLVKLVSISVYNSRENKYRYFSAGLDSMQSLVLSPFERNLDFGFSVPEYNQSVYYSYRIKGYSDNWSEYKPENNISLTGLVPGKYLLEVKVSTALNDANAWHYSLPVIMRQSWYKKPWVIALMIIGLLAIVIAVIRNQFNQRLKRQKELAQLRTRISSDLHDDVGTILSGLAMQSQLLAYSATGDQKQSLNEISEMSREAMEHMRDTVWAMDSRKDKYENLIDRMRAFAERNLALKNFTHEFSISEIDTKKFIDPEKRQAIYLIFKEAITNIVKHSKGNHVLISLYMDKAGLHLTVKDNGDAHTQINSDGLGISNMNMRAGKIGGKLDIRMKDGYEIQLDMPA